MEVTLFASHYHLKGKNRVDLNPSLQLFESTERERESEDSTERGFKFSREKGWKAFARRVRSFLKEYFLKYFLGRGWKGKQVEKTYSLHP